jgi:hypothetical protein
MTTLIPRQFYSQEELDKLYPKELELQLVQIVSTNNVASPCATADWNTSYFAMVSFLRILPTHPQAWILTYTYRRKKSCITSLSECRRLHQESTMQLLTPILD